MLGIELNVTPHDWRNYLPGVVLLLWTISPVLVGFISSEQMLSALICYYPVASPFIWFLLGWWKPDGRAPTILLGLVGHVLLFYGVFQTISLGGDSFFFILGIIAIMVIAAVIILSAIGSIIIILFAASRA